MKTCPSDWQAPSSSAARKAFAKKSRKARHTAGMTLQAAGTGWTHLSRTEGGYVNVTIDTMQALATAVGLNLHVTLRSPTPSNRKK